MKVWVNGGLWEESEARVSPFDHGLLAGDGVFETMRVYAGVPFALRRHVDRLARSAARLELTPPDPSVVEGACRAVLGAAGLREARVRVTLTAGPSHKGSQRGEGPQTLIVAAGDPPAWPATVGVVVAPWPRNERSVLAGLKTISYVENVVTMVWARRQGAGEALFANLVGNLCEGTGSNVFVSYGGRLLTPPLSAGCLAGVTRDLLLEEGIGEEADVPVDVLTEADEAFLTSSTREVQPVTSIDGRRLPAAPGPLTRRAQRVFREILARSLDP